VANPKADNAVRWAKQLVRRAEEELDVTCTRPSNELATLQSYAV
jgi:hypothetical protein